MCGIAGVISKEHLTPEDIDLLSRMNGALVHRGPDATGLFVDRFVGLAMRRLSIIDLKGGNQPIHNETGRVTVVCNGEIYNYIELQEELLRRGHTLRSQGDVETIVHLYEEQGSACVKSLRGMFALALWDADKRRLVLARDRMGEKPLYLYRDAHRLWFASEMKSLLVVLRRRHRALSPAAVRLYLAYQYVPEPMTLFEGVEKLPAGSLLELEPQRSEPRAQSYWEYCGLPERHGDEVSLVREELEEACRIMGRSDVPVGVALSGGIDSSVVAALATKHYPNVMQAFCVGYPNRPDSDERAVAEAFANRLGIPFQPIELTTEGMASAFPQLVWNMDDPIGDIAAYGYYGVAKAAREHGVPVLLSGLGGDEMFWGYEWVREGVRRTERKRRWRNWPVWFRRVTTRGYFEPRDRMIFFDMHDYMLDADRWAEEIMCPEATAQVPRGLWQTYFETEDWDEIPLHLSHVLNRTWLQSNCLALADRLSMAHSIEMRLPLLDAKLIELVTGLRRGGLADWKLPHKWLVVESVRDLLPAEVLQRPKRGFTPPYGEWFRAVKERFGPLMQRGSLVRHGIIQDRMIEHCLSETSPYFCYKAILLEVWCRLFLDDDTSFAMQP